MNTVTTRLLVGLVIAVAVAIGAAQPAFADGGTVSGKVSFAGPAPQPKKLAIDKDSAVCGTEKSIGDLVVGADKGLKYAVVSLVGVKGPAPAQAIAIDQKGCEFAPRVVVVPAGANVDILNSDGILHNIHSHSTINPSINKAQPGFKKKMTEKFDTPEVVKMTCDVHNWMTGWVIVTDNGYVAVTDDKGAFQIAGVPPGSYKLEVWHEALGKQTKDVTVKAGADVKVNFDLAQK